MTLLNTSTCTSWQNQECSKAPHGNKYQIIVDNYGKIIALTGIWTNLGKFAFGVFPDADITHPLINTIETQKAVPTEESLNLREALYSRFTNDAASTLFGPTISPPACVVGISLPKTNSVEHIVMQLQPIFDSEVRECGVDGVTPALFKALEAHVMDSDQAGIWERLQ